MRTLVIAFAAVLAVTAGVAGTTLMIGAAHSAFFDSRANMVAWTPEKQTLYDSHAHDREPTASIGAAAASSLQEGIRKNAL